MSLISIGPTETYIFVPAMEDRPFCKPLVCKITSSFFVALVNNSFQLRFFPLCFQNVSTPEFLKQRPVTFLKQ